MALRPLTDVLVDKNAAPCTYPIANTVSFRTDTFTTLLGAELHSGAMQNGELWHILAVGLPADFAPAHAPAFVPVKGQETGPELAQRAVDAGAFVAIAHPQWSGMTLEDARSLKAAHAVEIYNHDCAMGCDRPDGFQYADLMLSEGRDLTMIATDDAHFSEPDHYGGWVMVRSETLEPNALLTALKAGHFYSSQGPEIHDVEIIDDTVIVESSSVASVILQGHGSASQATHGTSMTRTAIPLMRCKQSLWLRVTLIDAAGKRAWTNPIRRN